MSDAGSTSKDALTPEVAYQHKLRELDKVWVTVRDAINAAEQSRYRADELGGLTFNEHAENLRTDILIAVRRALDKEYNTGT